MRDWADDMAKMLIERGSFGEEQLAMAFRCARLFASALDNVTPYAAMQAPSPFPPAPRGNGIASDPHRDAPTNAREPDIDNS